MLYWSSVVCLATTPSFGHPSALRRALGFAAFRAKRGKNEGFAPLCGAAATPVAALKTPVAPEEGTTLDAFFLFFSTYCIGV